ncbi:phosphoribosyl pyrophosphokinase [Microstroma glucosiphilum]|uniref:ribose-phosphate diphosphokinase n=1 Tax=Pseudomicrostroma glucosiphilum TaxID=1684307 RepID=A0A316UDW4_9BASI|nr:phosphoribosyl pyrophosphokinase [Pseudomicrostroma glucosiphilum]PWN23390.1 phosphoribosyl pyrophosphokinase [Pseudomicrostroma glucosiphilum]
MPGVNSIKLLTGNSHPQLAQLVAQRLGIELTPCIVKKFADQCIDVRIGSSVRDEDVFVLQTGYSAYTDPNDALMELCIIISACKTASARRITAVIPSFPYSRHDKKDKSRAPITAKLVANMITVAGADHVITMDLHASQIQGFFDIPVDNLSSEPSVARWIRTRVEDWRNCIIVSPDAGGAKRATALADLLGVDFALINRNRKRAQNKRIREARTQAALQAGGTLPSAMSSTDDLRSGFATPSAPPHDASHPEGSHSQQGGSLRSVNDRLSNLRMEGGGPSPRSPLYSLIGNGVQANESGEFFITDEDGHRVFSGGAHAGHGHAHAHTQSQGPSNGVAGQGQLSPASFAAAEAAESALQEGEAKMEILVGDVEGKVAILVDDMVDTGRTLALAAKTLRDAGAKEVYAHISHGILSGKAVELLRKLEMKRLVVTNTIPNEEKAQDANGRLEIMDVSAVMAESIRRAHHGESIAVLFEEQGGVMV